MTNQDTLREIQRGYRLEKPNISNIPKYPGDVTPDKLNGIYGVGYFHAKYFSRFIR